MALRKHVEMGYWLRHEGMGHMGDTAGESGAEKGEVGYGERG